jgi:hypothetical protein
MGSVLGSDMETGRGARNGVRSFWLADEIVRPASAHGMSALPNDVLIVDDNPIIAARLRPSQEDSPLHDQHLPQH